MSKTPSSEPPLQLTTPEERLQHDIEELEAGVGWKGVVRWIAILAVAVGAAALFYYNSPREDPKKAPRMTAKGGMMLEVVEPANGKLAAPPSRFRWESVAGRGDYTFKLMEKGVPIPLAERVVRENSAELLPHEASGLKAGGSYIWEAQARGKDGKILGTARGQFQL